jgi:NADH-quinone oxidoreductase subunit N
MYAAWLSNLQSALAVDLQAFLPELVLCGGIVVLLLLRLMTALNHWHLGWVALLFTVVALVVAHGQWQGSLPGEITLARPADLTGSNANPSYPIFTGLLVYDNFTIFLRLFLLIFAGLIIVLTLMTGIPDREDSADFYVLLLGATLGMSLMASSNHLLMVFIGVEMASLPSYALAGFLKGRRQSSEAALKYVVYGGGASGIMLYGISLLAGKFGTTYLPDLALGYAAILNSSAAADPILILGTLFVLIGIGFKLAAVPFHFWCPDVFEGASAEVAAFLSVASKGAALALLGRFALVVAGLGELNPNHDTWLRVAQYLAPAIGAIAAVTATFGNLAAYMQTNLKRLLAYSTIAHAGYMMMGLATFTPDGAAAVLYYLVAYLVMNLGAFAVVAFLRNQTGSEDLSSFRGLIQRAPVLVVTLAFFLFSLLGLPPLAGFFAKVQVFLALYQAGQAYTANDLPALGAWMYTLLVIGGLNTVVSLVYYVKVLKVMILDKPLEDVEGRTPAPVALPGGPLVYAVLLAAVVLGLGIFSNIVDNYTKAGVDRFHTPAASPTAVAQREAGKP